jgi:hypothetical protein
MIVTGTNQNQSGLNTSFSAMNHQLSEKWRNINKDKKGAITGRPQQTQSSTNLSQTMNNGFQARNSLNTSNNKFQSKVQGGAFANRVQNASKPYDQLSGGNNSLGG